MFNVLKKFVHDSTNDSLSTTSLESTIIGGQQKILDEMKKLTSNNALLVEINKKLTRALETPRPVASGSGSFFSEDIYVSVGDKETVYCLCTFTGFEPGNVDDHWVKCVLSLLSVATSKCNVGLMYLPRVLDIEDVDEDTYNVDGYSHICGILTFKSKVFYLIGNRQPIDGEEGLVFSLLGESPRNSSGTHQKAEVFLKRKFPQFRKFKVSVISYKNYLEWKWDQEDIDLWYNSNLGMRRPDHGVHFPSLFPKSFEGQTNKDVISAKMKDSTQRILHLFRVLKMVCDSRNELDSPYAGTSVSDVFTPVIEALSTDNECAEHIVAGTVLDMLAESLVEGDAMVSSQNEPFQSLGSDGCVVTELKDMSVRLKGTILHLSNETNMS